MGDSVSWSESYQLEFMDKQIRKLSKSQSRNFLDYDNDDYFPLIRSSEDRNRASPGTDLTDLRLVSEIDKKMKDYSDFVLHSLECLSARVSQLESRAFQLENAIDDLKEAIELYSMKRDRKQKELEDMLIQFQGVVKDLKEEPELARPQLSKNDPQLEKQDRTGKPGQTLPVPVTLPQAPSPSSSAPNLPHHTPTMAAPETVPPPHIIREGRLHSFSAAGPLLLSPTSQIVTPKQEFYFRGPWSGLFQGTTSQSGQSTQHIRPNPPFGN